MNAFAVVQQFEKRVAEYAGAKHAVAVDCCTNAIFLSLEWLKASGQAEHREILLPARTYVSVPQACIHAGFFVRFKDISWQGVYQIMPWNVWDGAKRFTRGMYQGGLHCLSFHAKKILPIGRGGMVLTDDDSAATWLRKARYDGRDGLPYTQESITMLGWHAYMLPEQAARGMYLMDTLPDINADLTEEYPDLRRFPVFNGKMKAAA